jgi:protein MPE1
MWSERSAIGNCGVQLSYTLIFTGHWIQDCPTNSDREFDNKPRIKRTTGIPRSFLKAVENPNKGEITQGVMVTPEGGYVVAQPDL